MKRFPLRMMTAAMAVVALAACSDDKNDDPVAGGNTEDSAANIDYTSANAASWGNYMQQVANLLAQDATDLNAAWSTSFEGGSPFTAVFRDHAGDSYPTALSSIQEIVEGCASIASEVGVEKIGHPYREYLAGNTTAALYAVESWYSWHSRDDYANNIRSIRNSYFGTLDGSVAPNSISTLVAAVNPAMDTNIKNAIQAALDAIIAIPQPLRNNINSNESRAAMTACADLEELLANDLKGALPTLDRSRMQAVVDQYVNAVVLPTYASLETKVKDLRSAVSAFKASPSNSNFAAACNAWLEARQPWETSEAFLFGPVDALGLDPNMDSWPLDQDMIVQILNSGNFDNLTWGEGDDEAAVEAVQSVRGFHTLEFLLFKDGKPRTVN